MTYLENKENKPPLLSQEQLGELLQVANRLARYLTRKVRPEGWVYDVRLFGSLARGESTTNSDVDVGILTNHDISSSKVYPYALRVMVDHIESFVEIEKITYEINPCLVMTRWLDEGSTTTIVKREVLEAIKNGRKFPFVKE